MTTSETALIGIGALVALFMVFVLGRAGGDFGRIVTATRSFFRGIGDLSFAGELQQLLAPKVQSKESLSGESVRILGLLQREGRLIDFLMEDIRSATPDQIVAAVRDIHPLCQSALKKHVTLATVLPNEEGENVEVPAGFDPAAIRLVGNVTGAPPFRGALRHSGWRVTEIQFPSVASGPNDLILMPAEVEVN